MSGQTVHTYSGVLLSLRKEVLTTWMKLEDIMLSEISKSQKDKYYMSLLLEVSKVVKFIETK